MFAVAQGLEETVAEEFDGGGEVFGGHAVEATVRGEESVGGEDVEVGVEATPISPPSGPVQWLFQGPPAESKLLAANPSYADDRKVLSFCLKTLRCCDEISRIGFADHETNVRAANRPRVALSRR